MPSIHSTASLTPRSASLQNPAMTNFTRSGPKPSACVFFIYQIVLFKFTVGLSNHNPKINLHKTGKKRGHLSVLYSCNV